MDSTRNKYGHGDRPQGVLAKVLRSVSLFLFAALMGVLCIIAGISTSFITSDVHEFTYYVADNLMLNIVAAVVLIALLWFAERRTRRLRKRIESDERLFKFIRYSLLAIAMVLQVLWLLSTQALPESDALSVQDAAAAALNGDYSTFANDAYMGTYKNQAGLFWISLLFGRVFGPNNYLAFQLFNAVGVIVALAYLGNVTGQFEGGRAAHLCTIALAIAFYPFCQYSSFVYGTVWGFALAMFAIYHEVAFFESHYPRHAAFSAGGILVAMLFKSNYAVFLIAMVVYALGEAIRTRKGTSLILAALLIVSFGIQSTVPVAGARMLTGQPLDQGSSSLSWIAMGQQEGPRAPGWYNRYNLNSYRDAGCVSEVQAEANKQDLADSLRDFAIHKNKAAEFELKKTASQWNNPTFQGFWNVQVRESATKLSEPVRALMSPQGVHGAAICLNYLQFAIIAGVLCWCALRPARTTRAGIVALVFFGGFLCHVLWEAKCQYTIPYFEAILPLCVLGYIELVRRLRNACPATDRTRSALGLQLPGIAGFAGAIVLMLALTAFGVTDSITGDEQAYFEYLSNTHETTLSEQSL